MSSPGHTAYTEQRILNDAFDATYTAHDVIPFVETTQGSVAARLTGTASGAKVALDVNFLAGGANGNINLAQWNGVAPAAAAALADGVSSTAVVPRIAADMQGLRSDGTANSDRAILTKTGDLDTAGTTETVAYVSPRASGSGGSVPTALVDNAGFTDTTSAVTPAGYIFDEVAGTALTENDVAAARLDSKRSQVIVIEDTTTRGNRMVVSAGGALTVIPIPATALVAYAARITTNTTTTPTSSTAYISTISITTETAGTTSTIIIRDKSGTPLVLVPSAVTTVAAITTYNFQSPIKMTSGIDIVTAGAVAATVDVWISYYQ